MAGLLIKRLVPTLLSYSAALKITNNVSFNDDNPLQIILLSAAVRI